jgi:N-acetylmuramate 1-kinase
MIDDLRTLALRDWLENDLLLTIEQFNPASSDASFRRYFRVQTAEGTFIVMDAPPDKEPLAPFIRVAGLMYEAELHTPAIFQKNLDDGFLLLEDLGSQCFSQYLTEHNTEQLYQTACDGLFKLQSKTELLNSPLPSYDSALLQRELIIFEEWFLEQHLDVVIPTELWQSVCNTLINSALEQPVTLVHRDYHSRNLMVLDDESLGVIDFQDAVLGPITYDLVSLLRDCYIALPVQQVEHWLNQHYQRLQQAGLLACEFAQFKRWFNLMGLQRHLKAIGIFARLNHRDNKPDYLNDIPRTLNYVLEQTEQYSEFADFHSFLKNNVLPLL